MDILSPHLPEKFLEKLSLIISPTKLPTVLNAFMKKPLPSFRINTLITPTKDVEKILCEHGFELQSVAWYGDAFILMNKSIRELSQTDTFRSGAIYIQNLSSMLPSLLLDPQPDEKVLDIAAAPGSKTSQLAVLMKNTGEIIANDLSRARLYRLKDILSLQQIQNTKITNYDGQRIWKQFPEYFDKTLVDAPCSMEGMFVSSNPKTYQDWRPKKPKILSSKQGYLLRSAIAATKPGGTIVYSTCTLSPEENEGVIDWILKKEGDAIEIKELRIPELTVEQGITHWHKDYHPDVIKTVRILPSETMEGFFVAKIKKLRSNLPVDI